MTHNLHKSILRAYDIQAAFIMKHYLKMMHILSVPALQVFLHKNNKNQVVVA